MLKEISITELKPGMYVQGIVEQKGNMKIKSQGKVTSLSIVDRLREKGIVKVLIDLSKEFQVDQPEEATVEGNSAGTSQTAPDPQPEANSKKPKISFDDEICLAKKLHDKGKIVQRKMLNSVAQGLPLDIKMPQEFTEQLVSSIDRNPNALMCLTKIREKDSYLLEHSLNVAILLANFGKHLNLPEEEVQELALAGFLHDIGKIKVPDEILHKPGRLTDPEMNIMRDHVYYGVQTLEEMQMPQHIIRIMAEHHERLDGYGYPEGLRGDEISQFGRMIAIVDTYDAIVADRCYKPGMPSQKALKILLGDSPEKYDGQLVQQFVKCVGIYPVGSLVKLNNEQVGMVVSQHPDSPLNPVVKIFYSARNRNYMQPKEVDLAGSPMKVEKGVIPSDFGINFNRFFEEKIAI